MIPVLVPNVARVKLPANDFGLCDRKLENNFNTTSVRNIIEQGVNAYKRTSKDSPDNCMLRLAGSDVHIFGECLLADLPSVR